LEREKSELQSKTADVLSREEVLAKTMESSKEATENLRRKESTLSSLEQSLNAREKDLCERDQALDSRLSEIVQREKLSEQSQVLKTKVYQEEQRLNELQSKCEDASSRLQSLQDEAGNLRPVLSEAVTRFEKESKELEDMTRRKQMLAHEVSVRSFISVTM
jgi:chromosome segregation ATPase